MSIEDLTKVQDFPEVPDACSPGDKQRLRIHVPNIKSTLTMGARAPGGGIRDNDTGAPNFDGFGVDTVGHVFVNARGGKDDSKMNIQANGQILMQSDQDSLYLVSAAPAVLASTAVTNIAAGGGVNIAAGWGSNVANPSCDGGTGPGAPEALTSLPGHLDSISSFWGNVDSAMAGAAIAASVLQSRFANPGSSWLGALFGFGNLSAAACIANNNLGAAKALAGGGVTIHGTQGWVLGTPLYGGAYAALGLTIGSAFPAMMALVDAGIIATRDIGMASGREIGVTARKAVSILGGDKVEIASRGGGGTAVKGKTIVIGSAAGAGGQVSTDGVGIVANKIAIGGRKSLALTAKNKGSFRAKQLSLGGDKVTVSGNTAASIQAKKVGVWGDNNVCVGTKGFFVNVGKSNLKLGNIKKPLPDAPAYEPPSMDEILEAMATDRPMANMRALKTDAEESHAAKLEAWLEKCAELDSKNCSIELKNGNIEIVVQGNKFKIDGGKTCMSGNVTIKK
ncbi:MAG: hypothetical protein KF729_25620 [Sandaracinaceae bacterium]|nr:hypothetical protein [Sandaracinaceae bacterium]